MGPRATRKLADYRDLLDSAAEVLEEEGAETAAESVGDPDKAPSLMFSDYVEFVQTARQLLKKEEKQSTEERKQSTEKERESQHFPDETSTFETSRFLEVINRARGIYQAHAEDILEDARELLEELKGVPVDVNVFEVLGVETDESRFRDCLIWLLTPNESHGFGDLFLRHFLARIGLTVRGRILDLQTPLQAVALPEFRWGIGSVDELESRQTSNSGFAQTDILLVLTGTVVPVEIKVDSSEREYQFESKDWFQAALYTEHVSRMVQATGRKAGSDGWGRALENALQARDVDDETASLIKGAKRAVGCLVHGADSEDCHNNRQQNKNRDQEHGQDVRHITWLDVSGILASLLEYDEIGASQRALVEGLRTSIFMRLGGEELLRDIESLRLRATETNLLYDYPIHTISEIRRIKQRLKRPDCSVNRGMRR